LIPVGESELEAMSVRQTVEVPEALEFDQEFRCVLLQRAIEQIKGEVQPATWQAFLETTALGASPAEAAKKLGMSVGAIRVAKCRVLARLKTVASELENTT
jgi:RNA polymerase sigma-70 factor (ECF subfamily)